MNEENGSIKFNFPHLLPEQMSDSCSLDVAKEGGTTLDEVGNFLNLSRERIRQLEVKIIAKVRSLIHRLVNEKPDKRH